MWFRDTLYYDKPIDITIALPPKQVKLTGTVGANEQTH